MGPDVKQVTSRDAAIQQLGEEYQRNLFNWQALSINQVGEFVQKLSDEAEKLQLPSLGFAAKRFEAFMADGIKSINVGGTMGSGKSTLAEALVAKLGYELVDADYFHTQENRDKQSLGQALTDLDRHSFLKNVQTWLSEPKHVTTCSALKDLHRAIICGQEVDALLSKRHPGQSNPWRIEKPNYGILQINVFKPYDVALKELDTAVRSGKPRMFDGKPHFIQVTKASEIESIVEGKTPLLRNQYNLLEASRPLPWDVIWIDSSEMRGPDGEYNVTAVVERLLRLPFVL